MAISGLIMKSAQIAFSVKMPVLMGESRQRSRNNFLSSVTPVRENFSALNGVRQKLL